MTSHTESKCEEIYLEKFQQLLSTTDSQSLLAVHVNVRGINKNKNKLKEAFMLLEEEEEEKPRPDIVCLSETHGVNKLPDFKGYEKYPKDKKKDDFGVCMYVKKTLKPEESLKDKKIRHCDHLWVRLKPKTGNQIVVGVIYRRTPLIRKNHALKQFKTNLFSVIDSLKERRFFYFG